MRRVKPDFTLVLTSLALVHAAEDTHICVHVLIKLKINVLCYESAVIILCVTHLALLSESLGNMLIGAERERETCAIRFM